MKSPSVGFVVLEQRYLAIASDEENDPDASHHEILSLPASAGHTNSVVKVMIHDYASRNARAGIRSHVGEESV